MADLSTAAAPKLKTFLKNHPVEGFEEESMLPGMAADLAYLKGILHIKGEDYALYATISQGKVEKLD